MDLSTLHPIAVVLDGLQSLVTTLGELVEPVAGASVWAGGNQVWKGTVGVFTARPTTIAASPTATSTAQNNPPIATPMAAAIPGLRPPML